MHRADARVCLHKCMHMCLSLSKLYLSGKATFFCFKNEFECHLMRGKARNFSLR